MDLRIDSYDNSLKSTEQLCKRLGISMMVLSENRLRSVWTNAVDCLSRDDLIGGIASVLEGFVRRPPILQGPDTWTRANWEQLDRTARIAVHADSALTSLPLAFALSERIAWLNGCTIFEDDVQVQRLARLYEQLVLLWAENARSNYSAESFEFNDIDHEAGAQWPNELIVFDAFRILVQRLIGASSDGQGSLLGWQIPPFPAVKAVVSYPMQATEADKQAQDLNELSRSKEILDCLALLGIETVFPERTIGDRSIDVRQRNLLRTLDSDLVVAILEPVSIGVSINVAWGQSCAGFVIVAGSSVSPMLDSLNTVRIASARGPSMINQLLGAVVQGWPQIEASANARPHYRNSLEALSVELCDSLSTVNLPLERREWIWGVVSDPIILASLPPRQLISLCQIMNLNPQALLERVARDLGTRGNTEPSLSVRPARPEGLAGRRPLRRASAPQKVHFSRTEEEALEQCARIHKLSALDVHRMTRLAMERKIETAGRLTEAAKLTFADVPSWVQIWHDSQRNG